MGLLKTVLEMVERPVLYVSQSVFPDPKCFGDRFMAFRHSLNPQYLRGSAK